MPTRKAEYPRCLAIGAKNGVSEDIPVDEGRIRSMMKSDNSYNNNLVDAIFLSLTADHEKVMCLYGQQFRIYFGQMHFARTVRLVDT